jgi:alkylation response protein AidB-like acyl-CoA dehydrogenase
MMRNVENETVPWLARARVLADQFLLPRAQCVDQGEEPVEPNLKALAEAGFLGLPVPVEYGGLGASAEELRSFQEIIAGACGVTAFVLFQHLGVCGQLARSSNEALKRWVLPQLASGRCFATLAFSHLRRPGPPAVRVEEVEEGYRFDGVAPWATGWGTAEVLLLAGTRADGQSVWVLTGTEEGAALSASAPMRLCVGTATDTVSLRIDGLIVPRERLVKTITREQLQHDSWGGMLSHSMMSLGVARAAIRWVHERGLSRSQPSLGRVAGELTRQADALRARLEEWARRPDDPAFAEGVLSVRCGCVELGVRAAQAAVITAGGAANDLDHPAQRWYREAMLYSVTALTGELRESMLDSLSRQ